MARAYVVGRFQDGTPVELHDHELGAETQDYVTNFNYADDMEGSRCPFHAHIRKTNPRGDTMARFRGRLSTSERNHRIGAAASPSGSSHRAERFLPGRLGLLFDSLPERQSGTSSSSCKRRGRTASNSCAADRARPDHRVRASN